MTNLDSGLKSKDITLPAKVHIVKAIVFLVVMYEHESWTIRGRQKNWCFWTVMLEMTLESPWTARRSNQSILKEINPEYWKDWCWSKAPILWPPNAKSWLIGEDLNTGKDWGQEKKGVTEDEMVGWHHRFNGHKLGQTPGDDEGQGSLACFCPWNHRVGYDLATERQQQSFVSIQYSSVSFVHVIGQQNSRTFSSCKTETLNPLNNSPFPFPDSFLSPTSGNLTWQLNNNNNNNWYVII